ncbi:MAG: hypothetical protein ACD_73C00068G0001, partial [uncultured bacterium]
MTQLAFIGTGNMAEALIRGILAKKIFLPKNILGCDVSLDRLTFIKKKYGIQITTKTQLALKNSDIIILSVKPQQMDALLTQFKSDFQDKHLIITIAAGLPLKFYQKRLGGKKKIIRVMPNTPAMVNLGASGYSANKNIKKADKILAEKILNAVGMSLAVKNERQIDAITALSGSGPAYVYLFAQAMIQAGIQLGLNKQACKDLVLQTILGATTLLKQSGEDPQSLIQKVASKGGTTEAAIYSFKENRFEEIVNKAIKK